MAEEFAASVEDGLKLSKRIYFGKDRAVAPPKPVISMDRSPAERSRSYLPTAVMVYAVIGDPAIVDNPDVPSYQPHVHGRCDPPALIPLQMNGVSLEVDCYLDTAFVTVTGSWRVHCVMGSRSCDCRLAVPMGEQGSILGFEVEVPRKSYHTELIGASDFRDDEKVTKVQDGGFLNPHIFMLTIPQVDGGSNLSIKVRWSQKLLYHDGQFNLTIPFSFPGYVTPAGKKISKKERIQLNLNTGCGTEVLCKSSSHPLKELRRQAGKLGFLYESEVLSWSSNDFIFAYTASSRHISGAVFLQSSSAYDADQRDIFCCYLLPGNKQISKVLRREVVFVIDVSRSMRGKALEDTKNAVFAALSKLDPNDSFNVIAFNGNSYPFSSSLELATAETIEKATQWINMTFVADNGTNIMTPLSQAIEMLSDTSKTIPIIFLVTDGAVEDERHIYDVMKSKLSGKGSMCPRIYTFGIGSFCNHYFLRMLSIIGRGHHDAAYDVDSIEARMKGLFNRALSIILANIVFENLDVLDELEVYPSFMPDLSSQSPLIVSGRYRGKFPEKIKITGLLADMSNFSEELMVQEAKDIPLDKFLAKQQAETLTSQAWLTENKQLEEKIAKVSLQSGVVSEYTRMVLVETERSKPTVEPVTKQKYNKDKISSTSYSQQIAEPKPQKIIFLKDFGIGFGNHIATAENIVPGSVEKKQDAAEAFANAASNCCGRLCRCCCGMCCIQTCSRMNDQCVILLTQLIGSLACLGCAVCCEACCSGGGD